MARRGRPKKSKKEKEKEDAETTNKMIEAVAQNKAIKEITKEIAHETLKEKEKHFNLANFIISNYEELANKRNLNLEEYISTCIDFYETYIDYIDKLETLNKEKTEIIKLFIDVETYERKLTEFLERMIAFLKLSNLTFTKEELIAIVEAYDKVREKSIEYALSVKESDTND